MKLLFLLAISVPWGLMAQENLIPEKSRPFFNKQWAFQYEKKLTRVAKYPLRFLSNSVGYLLELRVLQNTIDIGEGLVNLVQATATKDSDKRKDYFESAGWKIADSAINPLNLAESGVSDVLGVFSLFSGSVGPRTGRIKYCSSNLVEQLYSSISLGFVEFDLPEVGRMGLGLLNGAKHVGYWVDNEYGTFDSGGGVLEIVNDLDCKSVSIKENISPSLAIEKLVCLDKKFKPDYYDVLNFNCGGYTRKIGTQTGITTPAVSNIGIGDILFFRFKHRKQQVQEHLQNAVQICDNLILRIQTAMAKIAENELTPELGQELIDLYKNSYYDFKLQVILIAIQDETNQLGLASFFDDRENSRHLHKLAKHFIDEEGAFYSRPAKRTLKKMVKQIPHSNLRKLKEFPLRDYYKNGPWERFSEALEAFTLEK